jgi:hypothetical protein
MFNLDQAIAEWRRQMAAGGVHTREVLKELENHLREDIDEHVRSGWDEQPAFEAAVQRLGNAEVLKSEFGKVAVKRTPVRSTGGLKLAALACLPFIAWIGLTGFKAGKPLGITFIGGLAALLVIATSRHAVRRFAPSWEDPPLCPEATPILEIARQEASRYRHDFVGTEHLLLSLLDKGIVPQVLQRLGVESKAIRTEVENLVRPGPEREPASNLPFTPRAKKALGLAWEETKKKRHTHVQPEYLFLGLLLEGNGVAALALKNLGVDLQRTRAEILKAGQNEG